MAEYIERDAAKNAFPRAEADAFENCRYCTCLDSEQIDEILDNIPPADVVPVVRCGECKYWHRIRNGCFLASCELYDLVRSDDFFCADGERRNDG